MLTRVASNPESNMTITSETAAKTVHDLLFLALLDIRDQGRETGNRAVFHLAHLFHSVVPQMEKAACGACGYADVLASLKELAAERGCSDWLENGLKHLAEVERSRDPAADSRST